MGRGKLIYIRFLVVSILVTACTTTKVVTVPEYHLRDSIQIRTQVDSVLVRDSIYLSTSTRNDTVIVEKYVTRYRDRASVRVDTLFVTRVDTVTREARTSVKGVERGKASSWLQVLLVMAAVAIALLSIKKSINLKKY